MLYEHGHTGKFRAIFVGSVLLCAIACGANVACAVELLVNTNFENGFIEGPNNSGWNRSQSPNVPSNWVDSSTGTARIGSKKLKTYLEYTTVTDHNFRSEISLQNPKVFDFGKDYWFGWSIYVPSDWVAETAAWDDQVLMQFHGANDGTKPLGTIRIGNGSWRAGIAGSGDDPYVGGQVKTSSKTLGAVIPGTWNDFVVHVRFGYQASQNPIWEVWKDGELKWTYTGLTAYKESVGPYWKLGLYNIGWRYNVPKIVTKRTYYYDEIKVMGSDGSFAGVSPSAIDAPPGTPTGIQLNVTQ